MWRDLERICAALGLPLKRREPFPQNSLLAARVALALDDARAAGVQPRRLPRRIRRRPRRSTRRRRSAALLAEIGVAPEPLLALAVAEANKAALKAQTARAIELGLPGAPCLTTADGEVFWGNDRLEQGLDWAAGARSVVRGRK